jgi:hypothetical protein
MAAKNTKEIYDGFEEKTLSNLWGRTRFEEHAIEIQSDIVRKGKSAIKITIRSGDKFEDNKGNSNNTERDEIREDKSFWAKEEEAYSYRFSLFIPNDFPIVSTRLVLAQFKQHDENDNASVTNPIIALRYNDKRLRITIQTNEEKINLFQTNEEVRGKWVDFEFHVKFTRSSNGLLRVWLNKKKIIDYKGVTAYSEKQGYIVPGRFHFRFGLYRDLMNIPMSAYFDEYYKRPLKKNELK